MLSGYSKGREMRVQDGDRLHGDIFAVLDFVFVGFLCSDVTLYINYIQIYTVRK